MVFDLLGIKNIKSVFVFLLSILLCWIFYHAFTGQHYLEYAYLRNLDTLVKILSIFWLGQFLIIIKWPRLLDKINNDFLFKFLFLIIIFAAPILFIITAFLQDLVYVKFGLPTTCSGELCGIGGLLAFPVAVVLSFLISLNSVLLGFKFFNKDRLGWLYIISCIFGINLIIYLLVK